MPTPAPTSFTEALPLKLGTIQAILGQYPAALVCNSHRTKLHTTILEELNFY